MAAHYLKRIGKYCWKRFKQNDKKKSTIERKERKEKTCTATDYFHVILCLCSLTSFCELVNSLLQQSKDTAQDLGHLPEGILEVSLLFLSGSTAWTS